MRPESSHNSLDTLTGRERNALLQMDGSFDREQKDDKSLVKQYLSEPDEVVRLNYLSKMSLSSAVGLILDSNPKGENILRKKIAFYSTCMWLPDIKKNRKEEVFLEYQVPTREGFTPTSIRALAVGLKRDILYASMQGTPEMGIYKMALKSLSEKGSALQQIPIRPTTHGAHSDIFLDKPSAGGPYSILKEFYNVACDEVSRKVSAEEVEHEAVLLASKWLVKATEYNNPTRSLGSSYCSDLREAMTWARLGESAQLKLRGMRQKINDVDLHNIGRFVGKSGDNRYGKEARRIHWELANLPKEQEKKKEWTVSANVRDLVQVQKLHDKKQASLVTHLEKRKAQILQLDLPEEERGLQVANITEQFNRDEKELTNKFRLESTRIRSRTPEQLISEMQEKEKVLKGKSEKNISLAEMAVALHFLTYKAHPSVPYIDWINKVPFGDIKRAYRLYKSGGSFLNVVAMGMANSYMDGQLSGENSIENRSFAEAFAMAKMQIIIYRSYHYVGQLEDLKDKDLIKSYIGDDDYSKAIGQSADNLESQRNFSFKGN